MPGTKKLIGVFYALCLISTTMLAQQRSNILLSNHSFSDEKAVVGTVFAQEKAGKLKVRGVNARYFKLKRNVLSVRSTKIPAGTKWLDITIENKSVSDKAGFQFRIVRDEFIRNGVIAHRGAFKNTGAAENSLLALQHAIRIGCAGSEFDIHMSADSVLVINHDAEIQGTKISTANAAQLAEIKLSSGENMPVLEAFIKEGMLQNKTKLILEIKPTTSKERVEQVTRRVVGMVKDMKAQAWVDYITFDYNSCLEIKRLDPFARVAYLNGEKSPDELAADKIWGLDYHFSVFQKNPDWILQAKAKGLTINTWTVNNPEMMSWFLDRKVDFITTNEPEILIKMVSEL